MKRKLFVWGMVLCLIPALSAAVSADEEVQTESLAAAVSADEEVQTESLAADAQEESYTEKAVKVFSDNEAAGELILRFYEDTPNIPYIGIIEYTQYMKRQPLTLQENEDGTCTLENEAGKTLLCDAGSGMITVPDWTGFFDLPLPLEDEALGWKDSATRFVRITNVEFEGDPSPVELDFSKYGIAVYSDADDIYLPVSIMSNMMTDIATNHLLYNGENLYAQRVSFDGTAPEGLYESPMFQDQFNGKKRPDDIVKECYADLCFTFDYFFGHPGIAALDRAIAEKGLDQALTDLGKEGAMIKKGLLSSDFSEYLSSLLKLFTVYLSDGHTVFTGINVLAQNPALLSRMSYLKDFGLNMLQSPATMSQVLHSYIPLQRDREWGSDSYRESGNTAIIRIDGFMPDEKGWADYYNGESDIPEDCLGIVVDGLKRASENPEIENVIFDLSCNSGGSPDPMMAILAMTTGQTQLYGIHKLTGRKMIFTFEADTNFDGVYDEKDKDVRYDFNYGVLTTRYAFSCGNLFPIVFQEGGAVIIGEPTSGGSCCIQVGSDAEGLSYVFSSGQWQLTDSAGESVEGGCRVDLPIKAKSYGILDSLVSLTGVDEGAPSFKAYFNDRKLDEMMNDWFETQAGEDMAA